MSNGNLFLIFRRAVRVEKVYAKDAHGMPLPNAYGSWALLPSKHP